MPKVYLGDGVYVEHQDGYVVLTTENGVEATNTIYLDSEVWVALARWAEDEKIRVNPV